MNRTESHDIDPAAPLSEQAAQWWVTLNGDGAGAAEQRAFGEWAARSPERVEAWLQTAKLMRALKSDGVRWPKMSAESLIREARTSTTDVVSLGTSPLLAREERAGVRSLPLKFFATAAAVVLAIAAGFSLRTPNHYQTTLGEQRSVILDDGSLVMLNTSSAIAVDFDKERRHIRLLAGEALFQAAPDRNRPFEVIVDETTVRAVGTQFNIDRRNARTTVTVLEGSVLVQSVPLKASERVIITERGAGEPERVSNVTPVTAWTQRRLIFERRPLGEVAAEFNRYNRERIDIEGDALAAQEVTGVFQSNDPQSFLIFLRKIPGVSIEEARDGVHRVTGAR